MSNYPETSRDDLRPSKNSFPEKHIRKDWGAEEHAANKPNDPGREHIGSSYDSPYNVTDEYCDE